MVGRISLHARQVKCLTLWGRGRLHIMFQNRRCELPPEEPPTLAFQAIRIATVYALFTVKVPFKDSAHICLSTSSLELIGILFMMSALKGRKQGIDDLRLPASIVWINEFTHSHISIQESLGDITLCMDAVGNHLFPHTLIYSPFLILHRITSLRIL